jgi:hypothetical protein
VLRKATMNKLKRYAKDLGNRHSTMLHLHRVALEKFGNNKGIRIRSCLSSVIFPFSSKINKNCSHLVCFGAPSWKIFTNSVMQGKRQSNAKMKRKSGAIRRPPSQTLWPAGHVLWPPSPRQIPKWPLCL